MADADAARWDAKYRGRQMPAVGASEALARVRHWLPQAGRALDVAGGDGAQAVWLAASGLDVTLCDVSSVALERASRLARLEGVPLSVMRCDLENGPVPPGPWSLVLCANYLQRSMWSAVAEALEVGGVTVWLHPTVDNRSRNAKPSARFLLARDEGRAIFESAGLTIAHAEEGWVGGRHLSTLVGRRDA